MSEVKPYTAIVRASSEYDTLYGVISVSRGLYQEWSSVGDLMKVVNQRFPAMRKLTGWDSTIVWFETLPWTAEGVESEDRQQKIDEQLDMGDWVEVDPSWIDEQHPSEARTECDEIHIDSNSVYFSFYVKHSDTRMETPWLPMSRLTEHFERR